MRIEDVLALGLVSKDEQEGRVYGWIPGVVTDVDSKLFRVKARIGKQEDSESTDWLVPMSIGAVESLPENGDPVGVAFMDGDPHRGAYFYFPQSTTNGRPSEALALGTTLAGLLNYFIDQYNAHQHTYIYGTTGVPVSVITAKGLNSDGSPVSPVSSSKVVLSKRGKVR